jgi:hypothetical protein
MQRCARLADHAVHYGFRRQGVARDRDMEAIGHPDFHMALTVI